MVRRINPKAIRIVALLAMANMVSCYYNILRRKRSTLRSYGTSKLATVDVSAQGTHICTDILQNAAALPKFGFLQF